jgi:murein DD-endopeptidase MepM/ murein hydrolase activator NlpD
MTTPYDGKIGLWHWKGDSITENSIQAVADTFKTSVPHAKMILVKTSDGSRWQGTYDTDRALAIDGPASIKRWSQTLDVNGMEFHAWSVPKGRDIPAETDLIIQTCLQPGVRSMILDVEPYAGFWEGGRANIRPFMSVIRKALPADFHIGLAVDPRSQHFNSIFPDEWFPFINSVHLMAYWESFQRPVDTVIDEAFGTWRNYGRPLFPILQTNANLADMETARKRSIEKHGATGVTWWRLGMVAATDWAAINVPVSAHQPGGQKGQFGRSVLVTAESPRFAFGTHLGLPPEQVFKTFQNSLGRKVYFKATQAQRSEVWARWDPQLTESGWYEVSAYVPSTHATSTKARFKIHGVRGRSGETLAVVPQSKLSDVWAPLGVYYFDASDPTAGVVFLNDLTGEIGLEVAFDALRWRQIINITPSTTFIADGFDAPIGQFAERAAAPVWPGKWFDATGFAARYRIGTPAESYHTGADLNLNVPSWDLDAHSPVYAAANGVVTYADRLPGWGNVIIIKHDPLLADGRIVYGRYAHVENMRVQVGQRVVRGEQISSIGNAEGAYPYHLHFDVSPSNVLQTEPWHWPKLNLTNLLAHYVDPRQFVLDNRPPER